MSRHHVHHQSSDDAFEGSRYEYQKNHHRSSHDQASTSEFDSLLKDLQDKCDTEFQEQCKISDQRGMLGRPCNHDHHKKRRKMMRDEYGSKHNPKFEGHFDSSNPEMEFEDKFQAPKIYGFGSRENDMCMLELKQTGGLNALCLKSFDNIESLYQTTSVNSWPVPHHKHGHGHGHMHHHFMAGGYENRRLALAMRGIFFLLGLTLAMLFISRSRSNSTSRSNSGNFFSSTASNIQSGLNHLQTQAQTGLNHMHSRAQSGLATLRGREPTVPNSLQEPLIDGSHQFDEVSDNPPLPHPHVDQYHEVMATQHNHDGRIIQAVL